MLFTKTANDVGNDVHDVAVALDEELAGDLNGADLRHPANVVAAEVQQHQVFGPLLGVFEQSLGKRLIFCLGRPARRCSCNGPDRHFIVAHAYQDFGAGAHQGKVAEV